MENILRVCLLSITDFLSIKDIHKIILLNKNIFNNIKKDELEYIIKNKAINIISKNMKKYTYVLKRIPKEPDEDNNQLMENVNEITLKSIALYYYKNYPKDCISDYYNTDKNSIGIKSELIKGCKEKYHLRETNTPSRYDLYYLIKHLRIDEIMFIGW